MSYYLGVDLGTTFTAAAVWRDGRVDIATLGNRTATIPSVVLLRDDGSVLVGEAAERRAAVEPDRVAREFKRRLGDPTPLVIGGTPFSADALAARVLRWVVDKVTESEGGPPAGVAVSYPANWGDYKTDLLRQAIARADLDRVAIVTEPEAAAIHYASQARVEPGSVVAVYDLGGGTFDAAVLRKTGSGWEVLGEPQGVERLGGVDFDEAVFRHVVTALDGAVEQLDPDDPTALAAMARLRSECVAAKETLSADTDVSIPVLLPNVQADVRLTRAELENMLRPALVDSITALDRALRAARVETADVSAVLLVGGSSRVPLVGELVGSELGRPVAVDAHPKYGVALGAAVVAAGHDMADALDRSRVAAVPEPGPPPAGVAAGRTGTGVAAAPPPPPALDTPATRPPSPAGNARLPLTGPPPTRPQVHTGSGAGAPAYVGQPAPSPPATPRPRPFPQTPGGAPTHGSTPTHSRTSKPPTGRWVTLGVLAAAIGAVVAYTTLSDSTDGSGEPGEQDRPTNSAEVRLIMGCEGGSMADCDEIWEGPPANSLQRRVAETCGDLDPDGGHGGTCVADFDTSPTMSTTTTTPGENIDGLPS